MPTVNIINSLRAGVQADLMEMWKQKYPVFKEQQAIWLRRLGFKKPILRKAPYAWKESIPFPKPWPYKHQRTYQLFQDRQIEIALFPYELSIPFAGFDEDDDQLGDLRSHLSLASQRFLQVPDKLISEYLTGVKSLNPVLNTCYDGVGLYSALDGAGAARFGAAGGNIIVGSGISTAALSNDFALAQRRLMDFLDPSGESPIFSEEDVTYSRMTAIIPTGLNEIFQQLTKSEMLRIDTTNNVSQSNWLKGTFKYRINPYLTDQQDWYVVVEHEYWKPFVLREPGEGGLRQIFADFNNSDRAREYNEYAVHSDIRYGIGPWSPFVTVKINN